MIPVPEHEVRGLRPLLAPERPGPVLAGHVLNTGNGAFLVDRRESPRMAMVQVGGNYAFHGDPNALDPAALAGRLSGFAEASEPFATVLRGAYPKMAPWQRVLFSLPGDPAWERPRDLALRRLSRGDEAALWALPPEIDWIADTWSGPLGLAASGYGWGAFDGDRLVAVACSFYVGDRYEDIGVVTEPGWRGRGLVAACAGALCEDIRGRGRTPSWSTSPDNVPSLRVAEKLGFERAREDVLWVIGVPVPGTATPPAEG